MIKVAFFPGEEGKDVPALPLFGPADKVFEKTASPSLLPDVVRYIETLKPRNDTQYVLVNAMGAGEFFSSNANGDHFPEAGLIHAPDDWKGIPLYDKVKGKNWPYGFPTFYNAKPFLHHRNKDFPPHNHPSYGEVELTTWNDKMKRVELVVRLDKELCQKYGGTSVWDKLKQGQYPSVSMGARVPFDTCSICLDWFEYLKAQQTFNPKKQRSPGDAVLAYHKAKKLQDGVGIRGLAITRADYCFHALLQMNHIFPDGRKVFVYNDYPRLFDISFVFIGADKTAKTMMKIAGEGKSYWFLPGAELGEKLGYEDVQEEGVKIAAPTDVLRAAFLGKAAEDKQSEILKDVVPSQFAGKAIPVLTGGEKDLPPEAVNALAASSIERALSTLTGLGMVLRPREFQRVVLIQMRMRPEADAFDATNTVFPKVEEKTPVGMRPDLFSPALARLLLPLLLSRSGLGPLVEKRVLVGGDLGEEKRAASSSLSSTLLRKIAAAYNGYRDEVMELAAHAPELLGSAAMPHDARLSKLSSVSVEEVFTPLSVAYFKLAFLDEFGVCTSSSESVETLLASANVERASPLRNT